MNTPVKEAGRTRLVANILNSDGPWSNYVTEMGVVVLPAIVRSGPLQWAVLGCSPNGVTSMRMGVQSGWGNENNLSLSLPIGSTYVWTKSASVQVDATNERPNGYVIIPQSPEVRYKEIRIKDLILGDPTAVNQWISDNPSPGGC